MASCSSTQIPSFALEDHLVSPIRLRNNIHHIFRLLALATLWMSATFGRADIFQWEYVNPSDPSQGKQQSTMLCPDGGGVSAAPNSVLSNLNLTMADMIGADLTGVDLSGSNLTNAAFNGAFLFSINLTGADLQQADFAGAYFQNATLTNANFSQANLSGAQFNGADFTGANLTGASIQGVGIFGLSITLPQLYSTASYQSRDLHSTILANCDFSGGDFSNLNLAGASIVASTLTGATFHQANLMGATLGRSYVVGAPPSALAAADFSVADLTQADLTGADLTGANFAGAQIRDANFSIDPYLGTGGITPAQLYSTASYQSHDLGAIQLGGNNLTGADFSGQNLADAYFASANLMGASFSGAMIGGAVFQNATGFTLGQLYSTASYQSHDLSMIYLGGLDLSGGNFSGQNLSQANLQGATLNGSDFSNANLTNAQFDSGVYVGAPITTLGNAKFTAANLNGADFIGTDVATVDFTSAIIQNAQFDRIIPGGTGTTGTGGTSDILANGVGGLTLAQLYSTASYQSHNLAGISLGYNNLAGVNLSGQNLSGASFGGAVLTGANFNHANLIRGYLSGANVVGADFTAADLRGVAPDNLDLTQAITTNMIGPDGHVAGLQLGSGQSLTIRNMVEEIIGPPGGLGSPSYATIIIPAIPVTIDQHFNMSTGGTLQLLFDSNPWTAVISFQSGIPVELGGTLDLEFANGADPSSQIGKPIHVFDWTGITSNGTFDIGGPYTWDISQLYTSGDVTLTAVPEPASLLLMFVGVLAAACFICSRDCRLSYFKLKLNAATP